MHMFGRINEKIGGTHDTPTLFNLYVLKHFLGIISFNLYHDNMICTIIRIVFGDMINLWLESSTPVPRISFSDQL